MSGVSANLNFQLAAVDAYHLVVPGQTYWQSFQSENRTASERFELKPGWRSVYATRVETALVKVTLADGSIGWGEATEPILPELIVRLVAQLLVPMAAGTEFAHPSELWDFGYDMNRGRGHLSGYHLLAIGALDVAVWDALARRHGKPVSALLGDAPVKQLPVYLSGIRRATIEDRIALMRQMTGEGLRGAKVFLTKDVDAGLREIDALRSGVPGDWQLMVDTLWSFDSIEDAGRLKEELGARGVGWLECPLVPEDLTGHVRLAAMPGAPIALGEHFLSHYQVGQWLEQGAVNILQPDICRTGFSDGLRQRERAQAAGVAVTTHMGSGSPIVQAVALQFGAIANGDLLAENQFDLSGVLPEVFDCGSRYRGGVIALSERPGLGVEVDEEALAKHCVQIERWRGASTRM
ncbi:MAG: mandelate racemase/muconate lactonizing enzyme family protein [Variovorax sp.]